MKLFRIALVDDTVTENPIISFPYPHEVCLIILLTVFGSKNLDRRDLSCGKKIL